MASELLPLARLQRILESLPSEICDRQRCYRRKGVGKALSVFIYSCALGGINNTTREEPLAE